MYRIQLDLSADDLRRLSLHLRTAIKVYKGAEIFDDFGNPMQDHLAGSASRIIDEINAAADLVEEI
jgi:hypothetical protein